jgi:hypothetical protein
MRQEAEQRQLPYLFKLRQSPNVKKHIARLANQRDWQAAGKASRVNGNGAGGAGRAG